MAVVPFRGRRVPRPTYRRKAKRVYAISFDLDTASAEKFCGPNWRGICYSKIGAVFSEFGFVPQQGSLYFGDETSDAVRCVMAVQEADRRFAWFSQTVRDLRMLRVDEDNDLMPAIGGRPGIAIDEAGKA